MVVIAALIGVKGLGNHLLTALGGLRIGLALEIGICIVLIAIMLDDIAGWANKQIDYFADLSFLQRTSTPWLLAWFSSWVSFSPGSGPSFSSSITST